MRKLVQRQVLARALPGGVAIASSCVPFIWVSTPPGAARTLQLAVLPPVSVFLLQVTVAWGEPGRGNEWLPERFARRKWPLLWGLAVAMSVAAFFFLDPLVERHLPGQFPSSAIQLFSSLPWVALFQPLFLVAGTYAFAFRISGRPVVGVATVVILHQVIPFLQFHGTVETANLAFFLLISGTYGLTLGWAYRVYGLTGPAVLAAVSQLRHGVRLLS